MRIVLDTNILLVSIPSNSQFRIIFDNFRNHKFNLVVSNDILSEYFEIIAKKTNQAVANNILEMLLFSQNVILQEIFFKFNLITNDKDDNKFVDCAIAGQADFLVTNDKHFKILKEIEFPKLNILDIYEFIDLLKR